MLDYFRQKKLKKLLIQNYELSLKIDEEIKALYGKSDEISLLQLQDRRLAAEKVAFVYDELKGQYPNFTILETEDDLWKVRKPRLSEGLVFDSKRIKDTHLQDYKVQDRDMDYFENKLTCLEEEGATILLRKAIKICEENLLIAEADELFPGNSLKHDEKIWAACMYKSMKGHNILVSSQLHRATKTLVAKVAKTNIILKPKIILR